MYLEVCSVLLVGRHDPVVEVGGGRPGQDQVRQAHLNLETSFWKYAFTLLEQKGYQLVDLTGISTVPIVDKYRCKE